MVENNTQKKILVVDDDREWNFVLKLRLSREGFSADQAYNGMEALEKIRSAKPDLVLLDINMPVADGWQVCENLRSQEETKNLPVMIISSFTQSEDILKCKTYGVKRHLLKPCSLETVVQNVRDILNKKD